MVGKVEFTIKGAKEMEALLKKLGPVLASKIGDQALRAGAKVIVAEAKRLVPVRTGALRDSITIMVRKPRNDKQRIVLMGFKRTASWRAHFVEFGTSHSAAKPFMRPAMDSKVGEALEEMGKVMARGLAREAAKLAKPVR
jgi:HK97 gp10 family phage protein